jgi:hypothetical protein
LDLGGHHQGFNDALRVVAAAPLQLLRGLVFRDPF